MLTPFTVRFMLAVFGVVIGAYLPLALFYLVSFFRRERLRLVLIWRTIVRLGAIALLLLLIFLALGLTEEVLELKLTEADSLSLGFGLFGGFLGGIVLFVIGLWRGRSRTAFN
jgi:hypothetical protein